MDQFLQADVRNRILSTLAPDDLDALASSFERVELGLRDIIIHAGKRIEHVFFVERGLVSLLAQTDQGRIEVGMIGREGIVGISAFLDGGLGSLAAMAQADGEALRMPAERFRELARGRPGLLDVVLRYIQFMLTQTGQTAYANANFGIEARLARWILMTHDRLDGDDLPLTHDFLSLMLGTRRSSVTMATHVLEGNRLIRATRGMITVRNREKLMELAGDGYGLAEAEYERLFGPA